jgi:hypothetical protein
LPQRNFCAFGSCVKLSRVLHRINSAQGVYERKMTLFFNILSGWCRHFLTAQGPLPPAEAG